MEDEVTIREARREDCQSIIDLSKEIANFHKHFDSPQVDVKVLEHDAFDVENPYMGFYVAVFKDKNDKDDNNKVIGYGHYFYAYTIRAGKIMHLQDLYVQEKFRNRRIGDLLLQAIAKKAVDRKIGKMEFVVADWNRAKHFYLSKGAVDTTLLDGFHTYQFDRETIEKIAKTTTTTTSL